METIVPEHLLDLLSVSITFSVFLIAGLKKFKKLHFFRKELKMWMMNLILSFGLGIPFSMMFYGLNLKNAIWVSIFSFLGAPTIYNGLQNKDINTTQPSNDTNN